MSQCRRRYWKACKTSWHVLTRSWRVILLPPPQEGFSHHCTTAGWWSGDVIKASEVCRFLNLSESSCLALVVFSLFWINFCCNSLGDLKPGNHRYVWHDPVWIRLDRLASPLLSSPPLLLCDLRQTLYHWYFCCCNGNGGRASGLKTPVKLAKQLIQLFTADEQL